MSMVSKPKDTNEVLSRVKNNVSYFKTNYAILAVGTTAAVMLMNPWSLMIMAFLALGWFYVYVLKSYGVGGDWGPGVFGAGDVLGDERGLVVRDFLLDKRRRDDLLRTRTEHDTDRGARSHEDSGRCNTVFGGSATGRTGVVGRAPVDVQTQDDAHGFGE